jgi:hypothetical protein
MVSEGAAGSAAAPALSFAWVEPLLIGLWLAGAAGFLVWRLLGYRALRAALLADDRTATARDRIAAKSTGDSR